MKLSKKGWDSFEKKNHLLCSIKVEALIPNSRNGKKSADKKLKIDLDTYLLPIY